MIDTRAIKDNFEKRLKDIESHSAPQWLKDRMEAVKNLPAPSLDKVRAQFKASAESHKKHYENH